MSKNATASKKKSTPIKNGHITYEKPKLNISVPINQMKSIVPTFEKLSKILTSNDNCLILDLEFYKSTNPTQGQRPQQIAGKIFNSTTHFNYLTFSNDMGDHNQMKFMRKTDLRYSEATELEIKKVLKRIHQIIINYNVKYVISYDNKFDFRTIKEEKSFDMFNNTTAIDLASMIRQNLFDHNNQAPTLENYCKLLNLKNNQKFHDAYSDVLMIDRICQRYAYDLIDSQPVSPLF